MMVEEEADWDLQAVVRRFTTKATASRFLENNPPQALCFSASSSCGASSPVKREEESEGLFGRSLDPFREIGGSSGGTGEGLEDLCRSFCPNLLQPFNPTTPAACCSSLAGGVGGGLMEDKKEQHQPPPIPHPQAQQKQRPSQLNQTQIMFGDAANTSLISAGSNGSFPSQTIVTGSSDRVTPASQIQRAKKRKNVMKKVCHVPSDGLPSDMWAWRKYGQKPIKGSPYPRGYYRCSSSKGCLARKQVERNRSDPNTFIVTYTAEHNHPMPTQRNSLAGSTRQKSTTSRPLNGAAAPAECISHTSTSTNTATTPPAQTSCSSPTPSLSPKAEHEDLLLKEGDDHDNEMDLSEMILDDDDDDDLFMGFKKNDDGFNPAGDFFPDQFLAATIELPWLANSSGTAAAAAAAAAGGSMT